MKKYPSIWITKVLTPKGIEWDVSVKLRDDIAPKHFKKSTKQEAISFCDEYYGGYNSLIENKRIGYTSERTIINVTHSVDEAIYISTKVIILLPKPCRVYKTIDIDFGNEPRNKEILHTQKFMDYSNELTLALEEVCS